MRGPLGLVPGSSPHKLGDDHHAIHLIYADIR